MVWGLIGLVQAVLGNVVCGIPAALYAYLGHSDWKSGRREAAVAKLRASQYFAVVGLILYCVAAFVLLIAFVVLPASLCAVCAGTAATSGSSPTPYQQPLPPPTPTQPMRLESFQGSSPTIGESVLAPGGESGLFVFSTVESVQPDDHVRVRLAGNVQSRFPTSEIRRDTVSAGDPVEVRNAWGEVRGGVIVERRREEVVVRYGEALHVESTASIRVRELHSRHSR